MSTIETTKEALPTGTWALDPVHSEIAFELAYSGTSVFRGVFRGVQAGLAEAALSGSADVQGIDVQDETLEGHLLSPDFFDAERHPTLSFTSGRIVRDGDELRVGGELTLRGVTRPVELTGTIAGPAADPFGRTRLGLDLETSVDRTEFGLGWNMDLPGGGSYLGDDVRIVARLALVEQG